MCKTYRSVNYMQFTEPTRECFLSQQSFRQIGGSASRRESYERVTQPPLRYWLDNLDQVQDRRIEYARQCYH